jgi:hypothetical protein
LLAKAKVSTQTQQGFDSFIQLLIFAFFDYPQWATAESSKTRKIDPVSIGPSSRTKTAAVAVMVVVTAVTAIAAEVVRISVQTTVAGHRMVGRVQEPAAAIDIQVISVMAIRMAVMQVEVVVAMIVDRTGSVDRPRTVWATE